MSYDNYTTTYRGTLVQEITRIESCAFCGSGGHGARVDIDQIHLVVCRGCIEVMFTATHQGEHSFDEFIECPVCAKLARSRGDTQRKVIPCRYRVIFCSEKTASCLGDAVVDMGLRGNAYPLPPGWAVLEMEAGVDLHEFVCGPCFAAMEAVMPAAESCPVHPHGYNGLPLSGCICSQGGLDAFQQRWGDS